MNITGQPIRQKPQKAPKDPVYLAAVHTLPCACCGSMPVEAHHCRDLPDYDERGLYDRIPGAAMKSSDRDAIPLCPDHHRMFHEDRRAFHAQFGKDYSYIGPTRARLSEGEVDF